MACISNLQRTALCSALHNLDMLFDKVSKGLAYALVKLCIVQSNLLEVILRQHFHELTKYFKDRTVWWRVVPNSINNWPSHLHLCFDASSPYCVCDWHESHGLLTIYVATLSHCILFIIPHYCMISIFLVHHRFVLLFQCVYIHCLTKLNLLLS